MTKVVKREEEKDKTIIYMIVGFCVGAIIALIFFEYFWVGVGGGAGMLLAILVATIVEYKEAKDQEEVLKEAKKAVKKKTVKKVTKKAPAKKVTK